MSDSHNTPSAAELTATQAELHAFIVAELSSGPNGDVIGVDEDLIQRGIVDSLGVQQLVEFCSSRYEIRVEEIDLVMENFRTLRQLAAFVERKQSERVSSGRLRLRPRRP